MQDDMEGAGSNTRRDWGWILIQPISSLHSLFKAARHDSYSYSSPLRTTTAVCPIQPNFIDNNLFWTILS